jgi:type II secretory ATPase GspE/PulE/Tfp pilus assembly ATPase PilB-like protein
MPIITATIQMGAYISIFKLVVFIIGFFALLPLITWVNNDAKKVHTKVQDWTAIVLLTGAIGAFVWLLIPLFTIGLLIYIIAMSAAAVIYVMHRNGLVDEYQKILTIEHIKGLFINEQKQLEKITKGLVFITANKNKVPLPQPKTPEFFGFKTAQEFFTDAIWRRASDVALTPAAQEYHVHFVIDGVVEKQPSKEREEAEYFTRYLKNLADLDVEEKRKPQTGRFTVQKDGKPFEWEVTTAGTTAGEQVRLKLRAEHRLLKLTDLGLTTEQLEQLQNIRNGPKGVFIVSGPKKNGITSTLYALIQNHDPFLNNINLLEKQPIGELSNVTQVVYSLSDTGTTSYAKRFQTILRTGPDIVGAEYCDDKDMARLACSAAAKDNKMTYVTMEAASVNEAMSKWLNLVADNSPAINCLVGISNQRLIRRLCEQCREPYEPNREMLRKFNIPADKIKQFYRPGEVQHTKRGKPIVCQHCQSTGFFGREAIFEIIILTDEIKKLLKLAKSKTDITNIFRHARMLFLQEQAIRRVAAGLTSINEVIRALSGTQDAAKKKPVETETTN